MFIFFTMDVQVPSCHPLSTILYLYIIILLLAYSYPYSLMVMRYNYIHTKNNITFLIKIWVLDNYNIVVPRFCCYRHNFLILFHYIWKFLLGSKVLNIDIRISKICWLLIVNNMYLYLYENVNKKLIFEGKPDHQSWFLFI